MKIIQPKEPIVQKMSFGNHSIESNLAIVSVEVHDNESALSKNRHTE